MIWHIFGWITLVSEFGGAGYALHWLHKNGIEPIRRPIHVPDLYEPATIEYSGNDYVGPV